MYAVGFVNLGKYGTVMTAGNNGLQKLHNKTLRGWNSETSVMQKTNDCVYVVAEFTQSDCENCCYTWFVEDIRKRAICRLKQKGQIYDDIQT